MRKETEAQIVKDFPEFFPTYKDGDWGSPTESCMAWGLAIGDGWAPLFRRLCEKIKATNATGFQFEQVKEKFGGLRAYYTGGTEEVAILVREAELEADKTCESCGTQENVTQEGFWITTLCKTCRDDRQAQRQAQRQAGMPRAQPLTPHPAANEPPTEPPFELQKD